MPVILDDSTAAIGAVQSALITESQFQAQFGTGWVLADGRSVTGSRYATLTGKTTIPDLRGVTLRGKNNGRSDGYENPSFSVGITNTSGSNVLTVINTVSGYTTSRQFFPDIQVGAFVSGNQFAGIPMGAYVTAVNESTYEVTISAATTAGGARAVTFSGDLPLGQFQSDAFQQHNHRVYFAASGGFAGNTRSLSDPGDGVHWTTQFTRDGGGTDVYAAEEETNGTTLKKSNIETRMKNVTVNHFIRIN